MITVGIDPGSANGGLGYVKFDINEQSPDTAGAIALPVTKEMTSTSSKTKVDVVAVYHWLSNLELVLEDKIRLIVLELVHSMPGQGVASTFAFGTGFGALEAVIKIFRQFTGTEYITVAPQKWKRKLFSHKKTDKEASVRYVAGTYPDVQLTKSKRSKKPNHNLADAICLAVYGKYICKEQ